MKVYLASSWKNEKVVREIKGQLEAEGNIVDAFCDPSGGRFVFSFDQLPDVSQKDARSILEEPEVRQAFQVDKNWLDWSEAVVLILPAGKSAHLEAGYAKGQGKHLIIYQNEFPLGEFDVMYGFADLITDDLDFVIAYLRAAPRADRLKAFSIGSDRFEVVAGFGTQEELVKWYKSETKISPEEWEGYEIKEFPLDKPMSFEGDVMTLREFLDGVTKFPCIACYQD